MIRRITQLVLAFAVTLMVGGCHHNKINNPIANVDSKQPDKVLFDRAMDAMKHGKYDVARITLQTLINTYPDSEFIARAKLAVGDSWYAEGNTAAYQQAEVEYKDFITFFPNLPEAAEAQLKIANMHYKQMEKPDRDFTHAMRAEDEYRQLILQFPDSKLVPEAKQHLREVQEVLAERQYRIGRFYFLRESYPAAIARLKTLVDTYPLYSQADDALMMLGKCYEDQGEMLRNPKLKIDEKTRVTVIRQYQGWAGQNYTRVIERYPLSDRADEARSRLKDLSLPIPTPTKEAIAQNKAEEQSRSELSRFQTFMSTFHKAPDDLVRAAKTGEPPLIDPQQTSAPQVIQSAARAAAGVPAAGNGNVNIEKVIPGAQSDPIPHTEPSPGTAPAATPDQPAATSAPPATTAAQPAAAAPASSGTGNDSGIGDLTPNILPSAGGQPAASTGAPATQPSATGAAVSDATSSSTAGGSTTNAGTSSQAGSTPAQAPAQVNEIKDGGEAQASQAGSTQTDDQNSSSSKKKKKKGLKKVVPF